MDEIGWSQGIWKDEGEGEGREERMASYDKNICNFEASLTQ